MNFGRPFGDFAQFLIAFVLVPAFQPRRLALGEVAAHRKRAFEQVYGFAVIGHVVILYGFGISVSDAFCKQGRLKKCKGLL